jgi:tRNA(fMet)-specific endonuclease VapC
MNAFSLDCDALIAAERQVPEMVAALDRWKADGSKLSVSAVALAEWCIGWHAIQDPAKKTRATRFFEDFVDRLPVHHVVKRDSLTVGQVLGALRAEGQTVALADGVIACQALRRGRAVVTSNVRHFSRIPGLEVVNPKEKAPGANAEGGDES